MKFPVHKPYIIAKYHNDPIYYGRHRGIDVCRYKNGKYISFPIFAPEAGKVIEKTWHNEGGNILLIDHGDGLQSWMAHFEKIYIRKGSLVNKGETLGEAGNTTSKEWLAKYGIKYMDIHLHWHCYLNGVVVDPLKYVNSLTPIQMLIQKHVDKTSKFYKDLVNGNVALGFDKDKVKPYIIRDSKKKYYKNFLELLSSEAALWVSGDDADKIPNK